MEQRLHLRFQIAEDHCLSNSVRHSWHAEDPRASRFLRYLDGSNRRWEIRPRGHAIPNPIEVPSQVLLELGDRLPVDTRCPPVGSHLLVGVPDDPFGDCKRLCCLRFRLAFRFIPHIVVDPRRDQGDPSPSLQPHYRPSSLLQDGPSPCPVPLLCPLGFLPLGILALADRGTRPVELPHSPGATGSHVPCQRPDQAHAASMPDTARAVGRYPPTSPGEPHAPGFGVVLVISTRHQWIAFARLLGLYLTDWLSAFSATLSTSALDRRTSRWFAPSPAGRVRRIGPSIAGRAPSRDRSPYMRTPFDVRGALRCSRQDVAGLARCDGDAVHALTRTY